MQDLFNLGLNGHVKIVSSDDNKVLLDEHNRIETDALEIITRCLAQVDFNKSLDSIKVYGDFPTVERPVVFAEYNKLENSMLFRATFFEFDFNGTINRIELRSSALNKTFAIKEQLNILKENQSRVQIDWKIFVTTC